MKLLKLTNTPECLKLAECLIGSKSTWRSAELVGISKCKKEPFLAEFFAGTNLLIKDGYEELSFKLEDLKVCPYMCLKNTVQVSFEGESGVIYSIDRFGNCEIELEYGGFDKKHMSIITLDLTNLPKGAEVVDHG